MCYGFPARATLRDSPWLLRHLPESYCGFSESHSPVPPPEHPPSPSWAPVPAERPARVPSTSHDLSYRINSFTSLCSPSWCQLLGPTYKPLILQTDRGQQITRVTANCSCSQLISSVSHAASGLIGDAVYTLLWTGGNVRLWYNVKSVISSYSVVILFSFWMS